MTIFQALRYFRKYGSLIAVPNLDDKAGFRIWCGDLTGFCSAMADLTKTTIDDAVTDVAAKIVADDQSFDTFYVVLTSIIDLVGAEDVDDDKVGAEGEALSGSTYVATLSDKTGMDPVTIISFIFAVARFIAWLRKRREG